MWDALFAIEVVVVVGAELGVGVLCTTLLTPLDTLRALLQHYDEGLDRAQPAGHFVNAQRSAFTFVHCAESREAAIASGAAEAALWFVNAAPAVFQVPRSLWIDGIRGEFVGDAPETGRVLAAPEAHDVAGPVVLEGDGPRFNNVASAVRAEVLARVPFPDLPFGEDHAWAREVIAGGGALRFEPRAVVHHAHAYTPAAAFERYRVDAAFQRRTTGVRVRPSLLSVLKGVAHELREDLRHVGAHGGWGHLARAPKLRAAQVLGQWYGSRGWRGCGGSGATRNFV